MKLFEAVKEAVTARNAAEYYGIKVGRNGMAVCPFHPDKNPSMKLDKRYHCFACQADGDVIDFVAKYFNLSVKESAEKLAEDFSVPYEKYQSYNKTKDYQKPKQKKQTLDQFFHEQQIRFFRAYSDYFHLLNGKLIMLPELKMMIGIRYLLKRWKNTRLLNTRWMCFSVVRWKIVQD